MRPNPPLYQSPLCSNYPTQQGLGRCPKLGWLSFPWVWIWRPHHSRRTGRCKEVGRYVSPARGRSHCVEAPQGWEPSILQTLCGLSIVLGEVYAKLWFAQGHLLLTLLVKIFITHSGSLRTGIGLGDIAIKQLLSHKLRGLLRCHFSPLNFPFQLEHLEKGAVQPVF